MGKSKKDKFSPVIYVVRDEAGYLTAGTDLLAVAEMGQKIEVASYNLSDIFEVEGKAVRVR